LHRHGTHDHAESGAREIYSHVFDDVRQLGDQHVVAFQARIRERDHRCIDERSERAPIQTPRRRAVERDAIGGVCYRKSRRLDGG
jgi:hypothetical protein